MFRYEDQTSIQVELHMTELRADARRQARELAARAACGAARGRHRRTRAHGRRAAGQAA